MADATYRDGIHIAVRGILQGLPRPGETWSAEQRDQWLAVFVTIVKGAYPVADDSPAEPQSGNTP